MDFLGTTTTGDLLASVTTGVQDTGASLWPLLVFVGIPLAFVIGAKVVSFIKGTVGRTSHK